MAERVRMDILLQTSLNRRIFNYHLDNAGIDLLSPFLLLRNKQSRIRIVAKRKIFVNVLMRDRINKTNARFVTLSDHGEAVYSGLNLRAFHSTKLSVAESGTKH